MAGCSWAGRGVPVYPPVGILEGAAEVAGRVHLLFIRNGLRLAWAVRGEVVANGLDTSLAGHLRNVECNVVLRKSGAFL